jgi:hypothetical protein
VLDQDLCADQVEATELFFGFRERAVGDGLFGERCARLLLLMTQPQDTIDSESSNFLEQF